jgi:hypothetical protein
MFVSFYLTGRSKLGSIHAKSTKVCDNQVADFV